jgi:hypothetical protein
VRVQLAQSYEEYHLVAGRGNSVALGGPVDRTSRSRGFAGLRLRAPACSLALLAARAGAWEADSLA